MLTEHQTKAIQALEELQTICDKYDIRLYLLAGTALGAVREKGMIRWDDDIDVGLLCDDWYKLKEILPKELHGEFNYVDYNIDPSFPRFFGKILCKNRSCIDVFLIAKWTTHQLSAKYHWHLRKMMYDYYKMSLGYVIPMRPNKTKMQVARYKLVRLMRKIEYQFVRLFLDQKDYIRIVQKIERYYETHYSNCYINLYSCYSMKKEMLKREWIEKQTKVIFERKEYSTVGEPDAYLTHLYGDYLTPPPESKRIAAHDELFQ